MTPHAALEPANSAGTFTPAVNSGNSFSPGAAAVSLRGLGVQNTLVLVAIAGPVIGGYFGAHVAHNGRGVSPRQTDYEMTVLSTQPPHGEGH